MDENDDIIKCSNMNFIAAPVGESGPDEFLKTKAIRAPVQERQTPVNGRLGQCMWIAAVIAAAHDSCSWSKITRINSDVQLAYSLQSYLPRTIFMFVP